VFSEEEDRERKRAAITRAPTDPNSRPLKTKERETKDRER
jgi:hypothetical protein